MKSYVHKSVTNSTNHLHATLEMENTPQAFIEFHFDSKHLQGLTEENLENLHKEMITKYDLDPSIQMVHIFQEEDTPEKTKTVFEALDQVCSKLNFSVDKEGAIIQKDEIATAIFN